MSCLAALSSQTERLVIGMISGTSVDGIDVALCRFEGAGENIKQQLLHFATVAYEPTLRQQIFNLFKSSATVDDLCVLNVAVGEAFARAALEVTTNAGFQLEQIDLISSHGQTVRHLPGGSLPSTLQIGDISVIAQRTGIVTVGDFRPADMAVGGQGAPLVPMADYLLFRHATKGRLLLNIGGIANVTVLPANTSADAVLAFDLGPGNALVDAAVNHYTEGQETCDTDGGRAAIGNVDRQLLYDLMEHEFLQRRPPKSTGREMFGTEFFEGLLRQVELSANDMVATLTAFTCEAIVRGIRDFVTLEMHELWLGGGGAYNESMVRHLTAGLSELKAESFNGLGIEPDAREALAFAVLGNQTFSEQPGNLPSATGAQKSVVLGKIAIA